MEQYLFSSPIGAFIFLMKIRKSKSIKNNVFSSPIGAFIFLIVLILIL